MGTTRAIYSRIDNHDVLAFDEEVAHEHRLDGKWPFLFKDWQVAVTFEMPPNGRFEIRGFTIQGDWRLVTNDGSDGYTASEIASGDVVIVNSQVDSRAEAKRRLKVLVEKYGRPTFDAAMKDLNPTDGENSA